MNDITINLSSEQLEYLIGIVSMDLGNACAMYEKLSSLALKEGVERKINAKHQFRAYLVSVRIKHESSERVPANRH